MSPLDTLDDVSLEMSRTQRAHLDLLETLRTSLELEPMSEAPPEGWTFTAFLTSGARVAAERHDDRFVVYDRYHPHLYRNTVAADAFVGWLPDNDGGTSEAPELYVLSPRQEAAEYHAEEIELDRSMGRED
jgi:hypothetical protein